MIFPEALDVAHPSQPSMFVAFASEEDDPLPFDLDHHVVVEPHRLTNP